MGRFLRNSLIHFIFIVALLTMIICNILSYVQINQQWEASKWVIHSHEVIEQVNKVTLSLVNAERAQQAYLFNGSSDYFNEYNSWMASTENAIHSVKDLTIDNPAQQVKVEKLSTVLNIAITHLRSVDLLDKTSGKDAALQLLLSPQEQDLIKTVNANVNDIANSEKILLSQRNQRSQISSHHSNILVALTALLSDIFLILCYYLLSYQEQKHIKTQMRVNRELERQNKLAQEATRLKSEFLANMSHELRTPLNAVIGFSELMQDGVAGPVTDQQLEFLNDILSSAKHLLRLINDVLDLSKVEAGRMSFHPEVINIRSLMREVEDILRPLIDKKKINFSSSVDPNLSIAYLDPARVKQIVYNYLSNALKFTPELGSVKLTIRPESITTLRIEVEDNGIGIKPADMKRLFIEFEQLDASATKKYAGTGLGLALTKRIVEAQGGEVGATSIAGKGSIFYAVLPLTQKTDSEVMAETSPTAEESGNKQMQSVLVIEDNKNDLEWIANILTQNGYAVETAQNGFTALDYCENRIFDLITLDLMLPDVNGYEILRKIRSGINVDTPVIVITAAVERNQSMGFLVRDYLTKPVDKIKLISALHKAGVPSHKNLRILAVDDDPHALKLINGLLDNQGYDITCVENPKKGLRLAEKLRPNVLILDLMMPEISGFEFIRKLHDKGLQEIPIVVWTAKDLTEEERDFLDSSVQVLVLKSLADSTDQLLKEIRKIMKISHKG